MYLFVFLILTALVSSATPAVPLENTQVVEKAPRLHPRVSYIVTYDAGGNLEDQVDGLRSSEDESSPRNSRAIFAMLGRIASKRAAASDHRRRRSFSRESPAVGSANIDQPDHIEG